MAEDEPVKSNVAKREEEILKFWRDNKIFEKTLTKESPKGDFVFYDGPPFATGTPHYGHILASAIKDVVPRYQTMRGYHVLRRWGWDCHGLPVENIVEKELKISGKKEIEKIGLDKFNETARSKVLTYVNEWQKTVERIGRWVDFDGSYKTMDNTYMESVWWALAELNKRGSLYEGTRVLPYCPRCETPIANAEIAMDNSYKDITDISVYVKFELVDEPETFLLVWTTTPWTLPGNVALAVNPGITYAKVLIEEQKYILAETRLSALGDKKYEVVEKLAGKDLVGQKYKTLFDYYLKEGQVYATDFVTTKDGTGIVHIAPAFGEDDFKLAQKEDLPLIIHVDGTGRFKPEVKDFAGELVKPKGDHQKADIEIIKYLTDKGTLFAKEKIIHAYPHCFRCETPLYYYAIPAWFIKIQELKPRLLELNKEINWIPEHLKFGRFAKSVESAPDWNISRNRFWATPLPIWKCDKCSQVKVIGSLKELQERAVSSGNKYWAMRHGEGDHNVQNIVSSRVTNSHHLTAKGKGQVLAILPELKKVKIDLIVSSDFLRAKETAEVVAKELGLSAKEIVYDERLREVDFGDFDGQPVGNYYQYFKNTLEKFTKGCPGGENLMQVKKRVMQALESFEIDYQGKNILIISHETSMAMLFAGVLGLDLVATADFKETHDDFLLTGEVRELTYKPLSHNADYELDLHRPYIDDLKLTCNCGGQMKRITEVIDCWFESGSMPFASNHYPFENEERTRRRMPADFVVEYIAQTRTWFYYMHTISTILFDKIPFKNVVTTGNVLAEDGQKMSKSKGNYPDPKIVFDKYGVDALRFYLLSSPLLKAEDLFFSEKGVNEVYRKIISRLWNVYTFYEMYADKTVASVALSEEIRNDFDLWILERLYELNQAVTEAMERYELDQALRPIELFIDDLSTWYLRRSRERFKSNNDMDKLSAMVTTRYVLRELAKIVAPFIPFIAEEVYLALKEDGDKESVHLEEWPLGIKFGTRSYIEEMAIVRQLVSAALELRAKAGIKIRQPLASLAVKTPLAKEYLTLIHDELNVEEVKVDSKLVEPLVLDIDLSPELKEKGELRDLIREVQDWRKQQNLKPGEKVVVPIPKAKQALAKKFAAELKVATAASDFEFV